MTHSLRMSLNKSLMVIREDLLPSILNSYSIVFFLDNKLFAIGLLTISFFNFFAGVSGFLAIMIAVVVAISLGFDKTELRKGLYSFNALLFGLGMGTFFDPGVVYFTLFSLGVILTLILSVTLGGWLGKKGLPHLSIPFVLGFWAIVLPSTTFENLGLTHRNIYWINEVYAVGGTHLVNFLQSVDNFSVNHLADNYFRALSSIVFQNNLISGIVISLLLLISSRIAFSLSILGFFTACFFAAFTGSNTAGFSYYNIGANYILTALATGGFFVIPSTRSYLWTLLLVPLNALVLLSFTKLFGEIQLPVFSLPFSIVVILFVGFLGMRRSPSGLILTPIQHYSPEINLYNYTNNRTRLSQLMYLPIQLPFWGEWTISQGHNGRYTHKGDWSQAFDFILLDEEMKSYSFNGTKCEDFHCYNKPVLAPADGIVEEIVDQWDDNEIGKTDTVNNWGNTIVIRHLPGLYTQLSHLKKGSLKVKKGEMVKGADILANCGNSGRSHQPHIHFQVQASPKIGARTIKYPFAYYLQKKDKSPALNAFAFPNEGDTISGIQSNHLLSKAFELTPNTLLAFSFTNEKGSAQEAKWEAFTDASNFSYLYCHVTNSYAYYVNDGRMFYFTNFYGDKKSLLYYFYLTAFKVLLGHNEEIVIKDVLPVNTLNNKTILIWFNDFIAPFINRVAINYSNRQSESNDPHYPHTLTLESQITSSVFGRVQLLGQGRIHLKNNRIDSFTYESIKTKIEAQCIEN
jgi:urea transporter/murein DD-endopeptidase MepM/ murein hydrolase activator NlpD